MATFKKGGTSRGAGATKKGFDYQIYAKGGGVKKYAEGGATRKEYGRTGIGGGQDSMPEWDVPQYSFSDIKKFFTGKSSAPASKVDETKAIPDEDTGKNMAMRRVADVPVMQGVEPPAPRPSAPQRREAMRRSPAQQRAMRMAVDASQPPGGSARPVYPDVSQPPGGSARPRSDETPETESPGFRPQGPVMREGRRPLRETEVSDLDVMEASRAAAGRETPPINPRASEFRSLSPAERERRLRAMTPGQRREAMRLYGPAEVDPDSFGYRYRQIMGYAKGGTVKKAGGGSCRGMGAATRGGKYTIK